MIDPNRVPPEWRDHYTRYQSMTAERGCQAIEEITRLTETLEESGKRLAGWKTQAAILESEKKRIIEIGEAELQRLRTENAEQDRIIAALKRLAGDVFVFAKYSRPQWGRDDFNLELAFRSQEAQKGDNSNG